MGDMVDSSSNYDLLITKLDRFIRKYYINNLIRGTLYTVGIVLAFFLVFSLLEYFFYFPTTIRKVFFYGFLGLALGSVYFFIVRPLTSYAGLGSRISHDDAAAIIGDHFGDIKDKLLNILQLNKQAKGIGDTSLIQASIDQKTAELRPIPFHSAIDLSLNKKHLKYALPPVLLLLAVLGINKSMITDSTTRIINNNKEYEKAAPFGFDLGDADLIALQNQDYSLNINSTGDMVPTEAYLVMDGFKYKMSNKEHGSFGYTFRNVQRDATFYIESGDVSSKKYTLKVLPKASLISVGAVLDYPSYTKKKDETFENTGNLIVPEGTNISWFVKGENIDRLAFRFDRGTSINADKKSAGSYFYKKYIRNSQSYGILMSNKYMPEADSMVYDIMVQKDQYPQILVEEIIDSSMQTRRYYVGKASDDYGIRSLRMFYSIKDQNGNMIKDSSINLPIGNPLESGIKYTVDVTTFDLAAGENIEYYFQVNDNDAVNGSKSAKSDIKSYAKATKEEIKHQEQENEEQIKETLKASIENLDELQKMYEQLRKELLQKNEVEWKDKQTLEKLLEEQRELQEELKKAQEKNQENLQNQEELDENKEEIKEKQEKLEELFEEALDPKKEALLEKIENLLQDLQKDNSMEMLQQMDENNDEQKMDMERLLELYKQLEVEKEANELMDKLNELAKEEEELSKEASKENPNSEELKKRQEELKKKFEEVKKELKSLEKKNEELKKPMDLGEDNEEQLEDIQDDLDKAEEQLQKQENKKASKSQSKAANKMKKMVEKIQSSMSSGQQEGMAEDIKLIRQLLENLVQISYDQEQLVADVNATKILEPRYADLIKSQFRIDNDFKNVEDSLVALANRNDKIESMVLDKVSDIKANVKYSLEHLEERQSPTAMNHQRRTMTYVNDLAVMLSESMQNMQQSMSKPGSGSCNKPGGKGQKPSNGPKDKISKGSKSLGEKLQKMMQGQKKGKGGSARSFAEAAAQQAAMRKALQDMQKEAREQGKGSKEIDQLIEDMDAIEKDLVNKRLDAQMLKRQQDITTRLLQAEKAEQQRELDEKRKSKSAEQIIQETPPDILEYIKKREAEIDIYRKTPLSTKPYYKRMVDEYYRSVDGR